MKLTRRGFFGGIAASIAAACLPKVKAEPVLAPIEEPMPTVKWSQLVYGTPIIYMPRKYLVLMKENI